MKRSLFKDVFGRSGFILALAAALAMCLSACGSGGDAEPLEMPPATSEQSDTAVLPGGSDRDRPDVEQGEMYTSGDAEIVALLTEAESCYYGEPGMPNDIDRARELYEKAAEAGSPLAMYMLGELALYEPEDDFDALMEKRFELQEQAYETALVRTAPDDPEGNLVIGLITKDSANPEGAISSLESAAQSEPPYSVTAMVALGELYQSLNDSASLKQAELWYEKAVDAGCDRAITKLARLCQTYLNDQQRALFWWQKALDAGYTPWYDMAKSYELISDYENALAAYAQGAAAGSNACVYGLGRLYCFGAGTERDVTRGLECFAYYLENRHGSDSDNYIDYNEKHIRETVQYLLDKGLTDDSTVEGYLGEGFMEQG
ncbi:MAG: SEL1-like repeat protein [Oscillospiraceae bacterium]|nr:SEL1-like repeat protein [Oscillospiraceae bacterium]